MTNPSHLASVLKSGREAQARRQSPTIALALDEIAPDEYPTFTRPISPELDESKRYTHDPPKRKRTNPWTFHLNPNSLESGDDCDRPLSRKLSRKASNVFHIFTPQRTRSNSSAAPAQQDLPEAPGEVEEHVQQAAKRHHVTAERRRSSLKRLYEYILGKRKDSATSEKTLLPAPPLDEDDHATGIRQRCSPKHPHSFHNTDPDVVYMTGALPASTPTSHSEDLSGSSSLDPLVNPNLTVSKRRKFCAAVAASFDSADVAISQGIANNIAGYSPPATPENTSSCHYPKPAMSNFHPYHNSLWRGTPGQSSSGKYVDITAATSSARHVVAPWENTEQVSPSTSAIGILPSLSSVKSTSHVSLPTFALPPTTASSSTVALHTLSRPHSPAHDIDVCLASSSIDPTEVSDGRPSSTFALRSPSIAIPANHPLEVQHVQMPGAYVSSRSSLSPAGNFLNVPEFDTRPSTAVDSVDGQDLRLRRSGSLRSETSALGGIEVMERFESVEKAEGWTGEEEESGGR